VEADAGGTAGGATAVDELFGVDNIRRRHDDEGLELPCAADDTAGADERGAAVSVSGGFDSGAGGSATEWGAGTGEQAVSVSGRCGCDAGEPAAGSLVFFLFFKIRGDEARWQWLAGCGELGGVEQLGRGGMELELFERPGAGCRRCGCARSAEETAAGSG
jgi:hypothetical protein